MRARIVEVVAVVAVVTMLTSACGPEVQPSDTAARIEVDQTSAQLRGTYGREGAKLVFETATDAEGRLAVRFASTDGRSVTELVEGEVPPAWTNEAPLTEDERLRQQAAAGLVFESAEALRGLAIDSSQVQARDLLVELAELPTELAEEVPQSGPGTAKQAVSSSTVWFNKYCRPQPENAKLGLYNYTTKVQYYYAKFVSAWSSGATSTNTFGMFSIGPYSSRYHSIRHLNLDVLYGYAYNNYSSLNLSASNAGNWCGW